MPVLCMPSAVSSSTFVKRLFAFLLLILHLLYQTLGYRFCELVCIGFDPSPRDLARSSQLITLHVFALALGKPIEECRYYATAIRNKGAVAARSALPWPCN